MADAITIKALQDASLDAKSLEEVVNGDENTDVNTRTGESYPSVKKAIYTLFEGGAIASTPFETKADMELSELPDGSYALVLNDTLNSEDNGFYLKKSWGWVAAKYNALLTNQLKEVHLDDVLSTGIYHCTSSSYATEANGYPLTGAGAIIIAMNDNSIIRQHLLSTKGSVHRYGYKSGGSYVFTDWSGVRYESANIVDISLISSRLKKGDSPYQLVNNIDDIGGHFDNAVTAGSYFLGNGTVAWTTNGSPITGTGGLLDVYTNIGAKSVYQKYTAYNGYAHRWGSSSSGSLVWQPWQVMQNKSGGVVDLDAISQNKQVIIDDIADLDGHLDSAISDGSYFIQHGGIASSINGFPITGSGGFLRITNNGVNAIHQLWQNYNGYAYRWGSVSTGTPVWQPWRGVSQSENKILNLNDNSNNANDNTKRNLIVYGSSTMWYLSDEFEAMADRHNLTLKNHGVSGDVLGGAGLAQGSNVVTVTFASGTIPANTNTPVAVSNAFGDTLTKNVSVELSNGVQGTLFADATFTATNLTSDMSVPPDEAYRVFEPEWYKLGDGVYVFNIGKNNVTRIDAQEIIDRQIEMIEHIPHTADFVVGGHFTNTSSSSTVRTQIEQINDAFRQKYGLKYFDVNELLFDDATWTKLGLTKTAADITAINNRHLPPSLSRDSSHLSEEMDVVLADAIEDKLIVLGYIT